MSKILDIKPHEDYDVLLKQFSSIKQYVGVLNNNWISTEKKNKKNT